MTDFQISQSNMHKYLNPTTYKHNVFNMQLANALDEVHAELLPEDKARIIEDFKEKGSVAMIGDGINDAPALATADIGISMGISGSALAMETGHVILMSNDIQKIPEAVRLARRTRRKLIENIVFSVAAKSSILVLAFAGHPLVWAAVLTDVGTCLIVILNSMLLLRETPRREGKVLCISSNNQNDSLKAPLISSSRSCEKDKRNVPVKKQSSCKRGCCKTKTEEKASQNVQNYSPPASPETSDQKTNENQENSSCCKTKSCKKFRSNPGSEGILSEIIIVE